MFYPEKKSTLEKVYPRKNPQFWSNPADIGETESTHKMNIFTKFHKDWTIIGDFLLIAKFLASPDNYASPSILKKYFKKVHTILAKEVLWLFLKVISRFLFWKV